MTSPHRQLTPTEMRQVDAAVAGIMAIVKRARKSKKGDRHGKAMGSA